MKLSERLHFSVEKPQNEKRYHEFKIDISVIVDTYGTFCLFCEQLSVNLDNVEFNDFNMSVDCFTDFYDTTKMEISMEGIDCVTCYFWVDGE